MNTFNPTQVVDFPKRIINKQWNINGHYFCENHDT